MKIIDIFKSPHGNKILVDSFNRKIKKLTKMNNEFNEKIKFLDYSLVSESLEEYVKSLEVGSEFVDLFVENSKSPKVKSKYMELTMLISNTKERLKSGI